MGLVSVMPQAWVMGTPISISNALQSAAGAAEPPQITVRSELRSGFSRRQ